MPQKGDTLFKRDFEDIRHSSLLIFTRDEWSLYAQGYKLAGDRLVKDIIESGDPGNDRNILVYPIVFLYRHCIELYLKGIVYEGNQLLGNQVNWPIEHKINGLWQDCRKILEKLWPDGSSETLDAIESCLAEFSQNDPSSSSSFRYHAKKIDKKDKEKGKKIGNPSLPRDLTQINLKNLYDVVGKICDILAGSSIGISVGLESLREM